MKLNETIEMMNSTDYKERFRAEYFQLKIRVQGLSDMLEKYKNGALPFTPTCAYEMLYTQLVFMAQYLGTLEVRAKAEKIDLSE